MSPTAEPKALAAEQLPSEKPEKLVKCKLWHAGQSGAIELRINGVLPPCGAIAQGAEVALPENYLELARHSGHEVELT